MENKKTKLSDEEIEQIINDNYDKINNAVNLAYFMFKNYGWYYSDESKTVNRKQIEDNIISLVKYAIDDEQCETGRILVTYYDDQLEIYLNLT